jgi:hypothetical protein
MQTNKAKKVLSRSSCKRLRSRRFAEPPHRPLVGISFGLEKLFYFGRPEINRCTIVRSVGEHAGTRHYRYRTSSIGKVLMMYASSTDELVVIVRGSGLNFFHFRYAAIGQSC